MAHELLAAESAREFFQNPRLLDLAVHHPLLGLGAVLWVSGAFWCAQIAMRKGRDDQVWGALALLFGILPLIVLFALPATKATTPATDGADATAA